MLAWTKRLLTMAGFLLLSCMVHGQNPGPVTLHSIGDSTMEDKPLEGNPERGWRQMFPFFFSDGVKGSGRIHKTFNHQERAAHENTKMDPSRGRGSVFVRVRIGFPEQAGVQDAVR